MSKPTERVSPTARSKLVSDLKAGREAYRRRAWRDAYEALSLADAASPLDNDDLTRLATAAALVGRDDQMLIALERLYHALLSNGEDLLAARMAFWLGVRLLGLGDLGQATGWFARAEHIVGNRDCAERGYLLIPAIDRLVSARDFDREAGLVDQALAIGDRFADGELSALARMLSGRVLVRRGHIAEGLAMLDQAMVCATSDDLSPVVTGIVYCSVIADCQIVHALDRAREWTTALANWCEAQPQLVAFSGTCLVHRAEVMQLSGAWSDAVTEARRALERLSPTADPVATAAAFYQEAEVHRLRGEVISAEKAYRKASEAGGDPQPGLALLRLVEGRIQTAANSIRRALGGQSDPLQRARLLPAYTEIMLAGDQRDAARAAASELGMIAKEYGTEVLSALSAHADGAVRLSDGDANGAVPLLGLSFAIWQRMAAPYLAARIRVLIGLAYRALGDEDGATLEFEAARNAFEELGARPDLDRLAVLTGIRPKLQHDLTKRELQVLKLVAAGKTNRVIAAELTLSEKTIDRHVSNILVKLGVHSRTAAAAFAYEHNLV
jgi:DNA-binding CsgD family transcriptional regulator